MTTSTPTLRDVFGGKRGRLLIALLLAEFGAAVQGIAYSTVLPVAAADLGGTALYGATLAAGSLSSVLVLSAGAGVVARIRPATILLSATGLYVVGVLMEALASSMEWVLAGSIVRGLAAGLLAGFGLSAIGGLFDDDLRPRVLGLFALVWLLPSLAGPAVNAAVTLAFGWRWAVAWPAIIVVVARIMVGRQASVIPWQRSDERVAPGNGLLVVAGLVAASVGSGLSSGTGIALFAAGLVAAGWGSLRVIGRSTRPSRIRGFIVATFFLLCTGFFGLDGLLAISVIEGSGGGVVAGSIAVGGALVAWSAVGLVPGWLTPAFRITLGSALVVVGLAASLVAQASTTGLPAIVVATGGAIVAGAGMGLAYPSLSSAAFDRLDAAKVAVVATAVAFGEVAATSVGSLLGGGTYSLGTSSALGARPSLVVAFALLIGVTVAATVLSRRGVGGR